MLAPRAYQEETGTAPRLPGPLAEAEMLEAPVSGVLLASLLSRLEDVGQLASRARFAPQHRERRVLFRTPAVECVLVGWLPGHEAPLHDHGRSACAYRVLSGEAVETLLTEDEARVRVHRAGAVASVQVGEVHAVANRHSTRPLVTLHLYSPPQEPALSSGLPVAIVGSGASGVSLAVSLSHLDVLAVLRAKRHAGTVHAWSRHGLLPRPHAPLGEPLPLVLPREPDLVALLRAVREAARRAEEAGGRWQSVLESLRGAAPSLWRRLPMEERRRFFRHLRPWWEVHRHRAPRDALARAQAMRSIGLLQVRAGRLLGVERADPGLALRLQPRGGSAVEELRVDHLILATGPEADPRRQGPLFRRLAERSCIGVDPLGQGLLTDTEGGVLDGLGRRQPGLFALGPLRRPTEGECTAMPEIREQTGALADRLSLLVRAAATR